MLMFLPGIFSMQAEMINGEMSPEFIAEIYEDSNDYNDY